MDTDFLTTALFVAARAVHFGTCLLVFGVFAFDRLVAQPAIESHRQLWETSARWLVLLALPAALLSGAIWLGINAINMSGLPPGEALRSEVVRVVLTQTHFGKLWEIRSILWLATVIVAVPVISLGNTSRFRTGSIWAVLLFSALLSVSLAWAGHGLTGEPARFHLLADAVHILICGLWPIGLLPLAVLLWKLRGTRNWPAIAALTRRFSVMSLFSVAVLILTGIVNSWILVGSVSSLLSTWYGRVLMAKVALFVAAIAAGAINLIHLKPRLSIDLAEGTGNSGEAAAARLQYNVIAEITMTTAIFVLVGLLGLLPPAIDAMLHEHHHHG